MKKDRTNTTKTAKRPPRAQLTKEEIIERMKKFPERKERFLATARASKS